MLSLMVDVEIAGSASSAASVFIEGSFSKQDYEAMATAYSEQVIAVLGESGICPDRYNSTPKNKS